MVRGLAVLVTLTTFLGCANDDSGGNQSGGAAGAGLGGSGGASPTGGTGGTAGSAGGAAGGSGASPSSGGAPSTGGQGGSAGGDSGIQDSGATDAPVEASPNQQNWTAYCMSCSVPCDYLDCYEDWFVTEVVTAYVDCRTASCSTQDDPCAESAQTVVPVTSEGTALSDSCQAKVASCGGAFSFPCTPSLFSGVLPSIQSAYSACLAGPCATANDCMKAARPASCSG